MIKSLFIASVLLLLTVSFVGAVQFEAIGADELKKIMDAKKEVTIVDARTEREFRNGHIPSAINIPPEKLTSIANVLPKKNGPIVFYCRGAG